MVIKHFSFLHFQLKERWEDLKKNISINPHGNRVRFVPIIPNNSNQRINVLPPTSSKTMLFKPFKPNHINDCPNKENVNLAQHKNNDKKYKSFSPITHMETPLHPSRFNVNNPVNKEKFVGLQFSKKQQEVKKLNKSNSVVENCNMNELENSLPKLPLHTVWTNDNSSKDFGCTLPTKTHSFKKPFSPNLNYLPTTKQSTNYMLNSKFQKQSQVIPHLMNKINSSRYFKSSYPLSASLEQKLHPLAENMNKSFFTMDNEKQSPVTGQNINTLEQYSGCINQPFNMDNIWKDYQCQPPRM